METSESGAPIHRHTERVSDFELAPGDTENIDRISSHIEKHIGPVANVFHEMISDLVHVDIHIVNPTPERNFYTLVTSGMSDRAMNAPAEYSEYRYSELMLCLPPNWPMDHDSWGNEDHYWPIRMLKFLARFPHAYDTWLGMMHTIPNGDPPEPFAGNTSMTGVMLLPPVTAPEEFYVLEVNEEKSIFFNAVIPLHGDEMELKLRKGAEALFDGFDKLGVTEILIPNRPSSVRKRRSWFPFGRS